MDTNRFDGLTRTLAATGSRRRVLAAALAGGLFTALGGRRAGAAGEKVTLCHRTDSATNPFVLIEVSGDAIAEHTAHGDFLYTDEPCQEHICGDCAPECCLPTGECDNDCGFD
jgi:hypothetical protein